MVVKSKNEAAVSGGGGPDASGAIVHDRADDFDDNLAEDLLDGANAYAKFIGWSPRRVYYALEKGLLPGGKFGDRWLGSKRVVAARIRELTTGGA